MRVLSCAKYVMMILVDQLLQLKYYCFSFRRQFIDECDGRRAAMAGIACAIIGVLYHDVYC